MPDLSSCVYCARPIPPDAPGGSCPACLLALALGTPDAAAEVTSMTAGATTATAAPPDPESTVPYPGPARTTWPVVPGYQILGALGAGGGGSVYRARQRVADREVAVKVLAPKANRARFNREVRALAALEHPHVVRVYEVGECDQGPFFSMELMTGGSLAARIRDRGPLPPADAAALAELVARGVAAVHAADTLHRDLKPGNVLLAADGTPKVADFGLAKEWAAGTEGTTATPAGAVLGTPSYMAPEQAAGRAAEVGPRTDVYGLGAVLYQTLTGDPPFRGDSVPAVLHQILTEDPVPPRQRNRRVPRELEAVCLKCLAKRPADRYESAEYLADDLARWQRGEPTVARPLPRVVSVARRVWRHRRVTAGVLAIVVGTLAVVAGVAIFLRPDPDAELKKIREELRGTDPVVLIPETGPPRWHRRAWGAAELTESSYRDGVCCFEAVAQASLELLPAADVPKAFRLRAEIRHERGAEAEDRPSRAGLYFGLHTQEVGDVRVTTYQQVVFSDWPPPPKAGAKPRPNQINYHLYVTQHPLGQQAGGYPASPAQLPIVSPDGLLVPREWRTLEIEVRPTGVRCWAWWPGQSRRAFYPPELSANDLRDPQFRWQYEKAVPGHPLPDPPDGWPGAGSLGLYLVRGQAAFRNVTIEPLPD